MPRHDDVLYRYQSCLFLHCSQVIGDVLNLAGIARHLRRRRFEGGALRLDNTKLTFALDSNGNPVSCAPYVQVGPQSAAQILVGFLSQFLFLFAGCVLRYAARLGITNRVFTPSSNSNRVSCAP